MDHLRIYEFAKFLLFQSFSISTINTADLFRTIRYPEENTVNISCWNTSLVQLQNISVQEEETPCRLNPCVLNVNDTHTIEDNCDGANSCLVDYNFTSACLREFRYINLSYTCKHENGTSVSTFEDDFGDWRNVSLNSFTWKRNNLLRDHTMISSSGFIGYSMNAFSYSGRSSTERNDTVNKFLKPICLSLWYQIYVNGFDCSFSIYKISEGNRTLLFIAEGNSTSFGIWKNISVDVYKQVPFKITLEAHFSYRNSDLVRAILVDDTSIAYRHCQGQQITTTCMDMNRPIKIECEKQFLAGDINLSLEPKNLISQQKSCPEKSIESELNTFCRNFNKSDQCKFNMLDFISGYTDCYVFSKHITVTYQCSDIPTGSIESSSPNYASDITEGSEEISVGSFIQFDIIGIAAGVSGGILITIIAVVVIYHLKRSDGCDCVTKTITSLKRKGHESRINETAVYECSNISSRLSDHAYDSFECANYDNMKHVPYSSTGGHHGNDRDMYINQ